MWSKSMYRCGNGVNNMHKTSKLSPLASIDNRLWYKSRRNIGIRDSLRGKNSFPHLIRFPKDYWPTPKG